MVVEVLTSVVFVRCLLTLAGGAVSGQVRRPCFTFTLQFLAGFGISHCKGTGTDYATTVRLLAGTTAQVAPWWCRLRDCLHAQLFSLTNGRRHVAMRCLVCHVVVTAVAVVCAWESRRTPVYDDRSTR